MYGRQYGVVRYNKQKKFYCEQQKKGIGVYIPGRYLQANYQ